MNKDLYIVEVEFITPLLGAVPKDKDVYSTFIATKGRELSEEELEEELETVQEIEEKGWTGFHMEDGQPVLYNYVVKGFLKDACSMLRRVKGTYSKGVRAYKKVIDGNVFAYPLGGYPRERRIPIDLSTAEEPDGDLMPEEEIRDLMPHPKLGVKERPLRAQTAQGARVTLARSDVVTPGATMTFELHALGNNDVREEWLREMFDYGASRGFGQWRNAGWGSFVYEWNRQ